jgi:hypothetical protein
MAYAILRHTQRRIKAKGLQLGVDVIRAEMNGVQSSVARQLKMDHLDGTAPIKFAPVGGALSTHRVA